MEYRQSRSVTTTGFALLAQVALAPASAYDLTLLMHRNLRYLWPRAESRLYAEVARLEELGLLRGRDEKVGRRVRRIMTVTAAGRHALRQWMAREVVAGIPLESEALLRVFFASWGSLADLRRALARVAADAAQLLDVAKEVGEAYLAGSGTAQEHAHLRAMIHELLSGYGLLLQKWSNEQLKEISSWRDLHPVGSQRLANKKFQRSMHKLGRRRPTAN